MANLDLIVTSDTVTAHLAGALGYPTWVALRHRPDWRWMQERPDSPWYPTMRLFRQKEHGNWPAVFAEITAALAEKGDENQLTAGQSPSLSAFVRGCRRSRAGRSARRLTGDRDESQRHR